jgi:formate hydrogenlyase subunit 3/multisubunit Na+/H+ antiporter MnhD subunit
VLSGIIVKAGLIGWLRFLPLGVLKQDDWGLLCLGIGVFSAFYGVLAGLPQTRPKTVLAYSSISQMGLLLILVGIGLTNPSAWPFLSMTVALLALHHGLAKAALFLGVGVVEKSGSWAGWCLGLPALALAGAPLTSGALAKLLLKDGVYLAPGGWSDLLLGLMPLSSLATGLLMARFLFLSWPRSQPQGPLPIGMTASWLALLVLGPGLPWWWVWRHMPKVIDETLGWEALLSGLIPLLGAVALALAGWGIWRLTRFRVSLPEGDILELLSVLSIRIGLRPAAARKAAGEWVVEAGNLKGAYAVLARGERWLRSWNVAGTLFLGLILGMIALLAL